VEPVRNGKEEFSLRHFKVIKDDLGFLNWWRMPEISEDEIENLEGVFISIEPHDEKVINKLFNVIKNIEITSVLLRLIDPQNYGILSPPVENILNIKGINQIEKYLNYLGDLGELKEVYNFRRIADVDMALWALSNIMNSFLKNDPIYSEIYDRYKYTANLVKKIMAKNSLKQIWEEKLLYRARLLLDTDYVIAGILAGRELEQFVKVYCRKSRIKLKEIIKRRGTRFLSIPELSEKLSENKCITIEENKEIKKWWEIRKDLTHEVEVKSTQDDVKEMIEEVNKLIEKYQP